MASASSSSARHLFRDSKKRLCERVAVNVTNLGSVARQVVRASKSNELKKYVSCLNRLTAHKFLQFDLKQILGQSIKNFTQVDVVSDYSSQNLQKMQLILQHVEFQHNVIKDSVNHMDYVKEQVTSMER